MHHNQINKLSAFTSPLISNGRITLPESLHTTKISLKMDEYQNQLVQIINKYF